MALGFFSPQRLGDFVGNLIGPQVLAFGLPVGLSPGLTLFLKGFPGLREENFPGENFGWV